MAPIANDPKAFGPRIAQKSGIAIALTARAKGRAQSVRFGPARRRKE